MTETTPDNLPLPAECDFLDVVVSLRHPNVESPLTVFVPKEMKNETLRELAAAACDLCEGRTVIIASSSPFRARWWATTLRLLATGCQAVGHADVGAVAHTLADHMERLATDLTGERPTSRRGAEVRFRANGSLVVDVAGPRRGLWCDHTETGDAGRTRGGDALDLIMHLRGGTMRDAIHYAERWLGQAPAPDPLPRATTPARTADRADVLAMAARIWRETVHIRGTPAEAYLRHRGLTPPESRVLRFHPRCPRGDDRLPAMIALMVEPVSGNPCGVHRTFVRADGSGKADGQAKMMLGAAGIIALSAHIDVHDGLGICEGIETGLAIMQCAQWRPVWSVGSAGGIASFSVLPFVGCLTIFPDLDDKGTSVAAAASCTRRWREAHQQVQTIRPPNGHDWHDALIASAA